MLNEWLLLLLPLNMRIFLIGHFKRFHQSDKCALSPSCFVNFVCLWVFEIKKNPNESLLDFFSRLRLCKHFFGSEVWTISICFPHLHVKKQKNHLSFTWIFTVETGEISFILLGFITVNFIYAWTLLLVGLLFMCSLCNEKNFYFPLSFD